MRSSVWFAAGWVVVSLFLYLTGFNDLHPVGASILFGLLFWIGCLGGAMVPTFFILMVSGIVFDLDVSEKTFWRLHTSLVLVYLAVFGWPTISDGFKPVYELQVLCRERSVVHERVGARCADGRRSSATGSGACSWHGGVDEWITESKYQKSYAECRREAADKSWID